MRSYSCPLLTGTVHDLSQTLSMVSQFAIAENLFINPLLHFSVSFRFS
ncbi:hypothetical protein NOR51B_2465 [Luminiphilus syltensis NOR5-1B]|uniref:Uncharacterized protein n=1 Tax=Luminiphilus syltensis NOR5-1B TaxID=565045 RepID=B8KV73_9GAMM|nr:hypothetical protein NOR51B_2465 [Luminiphilus syltensis NOR5-1B]